MPTPSLSATFWGVPYGTTAVVGIGDVMMPSLDASSWVSATAVNRAAIGRRSEAIAMTAFDGLGIGTIELWHTGTIDATVSGLAAGTVSWVRCSATGEIERFTPSPGGLSDIIGKCSTDGRVRLEFGIWTEDLALASGVATPGGSDTQIQYNNAGALGGMTWTYASGSAAVTMPKAASLLVANDAATGSYDIAIREGTGTIESVTFNGNFAGDATKSAPIGQLYGSRAAYLGLNNSAAYFQTLSAAQAGTPFAQAIPNLAVGTVGAVASAFGSGVGVLALRTTTDPTGTIHSTSTILSEDTTNATHQILAWANQTAGADCVPLTPAYSAITFSADADQALNVAQSRSNTLVVGAGVTTATRKLTSTLLPTRFHLIFLKNNNAQSVQFAFTSGTAVTVTTGKMAIIVGDNTNAVLVHSW